jgi:hypothetical protein
MMNTIIEGGIFHQVRYIFIFFIILLQACASTLTGTRVEGSDFLENLPGLWEGSWRATANQGNQYIKIIKVEGSEVHLTGLSKGGATDPDTDEVFGRIENSRLLLTWPAMMDSGCKEKYTMSRDASNKLRLDGNQICGPYVSTVSLFKKE